MEYCANPAGNPGKHEQGNHIPCQLKIYNALGQLVKTLYDQMLPAGTYDLRVKWTGTDDSGIRQAFGMYYLQLRHGNHDRVQKMLMLR